MPRLPLRRATCLSRGLRCPTGFAAENDCPILEVYDGRISICSSACTSRSLTARHFESRVKLEAEMSAVSGQAFASHIMDTDHWDITKSHDWDILTNYLKLTIPQSEQQTPSKKNIHITALQETKNTIKYDI